MNVWSNDVQDTIKPSDIRFSQIYTYLQLLNCKYWISSLDCTTSLSTRDKTQSFWIVFLLSTRRLNIFIWFPLKWNLNAATRQYNNTNWCFIPIFFLSLISIWLISDSVETCSVSQQLSHAFCTLQMRQLLFGVIYVHMQVLLSQKNILCLKVSFWYMRRFSFIYMST